MIINTIIKKEVTIGGVSCSMCITHEHDPRIACLFYALEIHSIHGDPPYSYRKMFSDREDALFQAYYMLKSDTLPETSPPSSVIDTVFAEKRRNMHMRIEWKIHGEDEILRRLIAFE